MAGQQDIKTLEYSQVVKIPESEGLLVRQCSVRLGEFGLTLWVVSILMYNQEFHNKKMVFFFVSHATWQPTRSICVQPRILIFSLIFKFHCKHSHKYSDVLFHVFADRLMPSPRGAELEHRMREALMLFINENRDKVTTKAAPFLKKKKLSLEYIAFMSIPGNWGDVLVLHLLAFMSQIHYCVITKTKIY